MRRAAVICLILLAAGAATVSAQAGPGDAVAARIAVLRPRPGQWAAFEAGYRRHLDWHRARADPWTWLGWEVITGERLGLFIDGTFGHTWPALDSAVAPAADRGDNDANVAPYADFVSHAVYRLRPELSGARFLEAGRPDRLVELVTLAVRPGRTLEVDAFLQLVHAAFGASDHAVYDVVSGAESHHYLVFVPRGALSALAASAGGVASWLDALDTADAVRGRELLAVGVERVRTELLLRRDDMSYAPGSP